MNKHDKNIYVAFGKTFMPPQQQLNFLITILNAIQKNEKTVNDVGFIISIRDTPKLKGNTIIKEAILKYKLYNVLLKEFVP